MKNYNNYKKTFSELPEVEYAIEPDWELVLNILKVRRHSNTPVEVQFVADLQEFFNTKGAVTSRDAFGNLYVVKGEATQYRCLVAHTDINQTHRDNVRVYMNKDWIFGFDMEEGCQCGLGADDGIGISLAIEMFNRFDAIKLFFPMQEEIGCIGSSRCDVSFFSDCTMILQGDRRSFSNDLIVFTNGIQTCSEEFVEAASEISDKYGYAAANGICTDI
jgi:tripeptide aminopeptidase